VQLTRYIRQKSVKIFSMAVLAISIMALVVELFPEMEAKPIVIVALILTIIIMLIQISKDG